MTDDELKGRLRAALCKYEPWFGSDQPGGWDIATELADLIADDPKGFIDEVLVESGAI